MFFGFRYAEKSPQSVHTQKFEYRHIRLSEQETIQVYRALFARLADKLQSGVPHLILKNSTVLSSRSRRSTSILVSQARIATFVTSPGTGQA